MERAELVDYVTRKVTCWCQLIRWQQKLANFKKIFRSKSLLRKQTQLSMIELFTKIVNSLWPLINCFHKSSIIDVWVSLQKDHWAESYRKLSDLSKRVLIHFSPIFPFYTPLKTLENRRFKIRKLVRNGLKRHTEVVKASCKNASPVFSLDLNKFLFYGWWACKDGFFRSSWPQLVITVRENRTKTFVVKFFLLRNIVIVKMFPLKFSDTFSGGIRRSTYE